MKNKSISLLVLSILIFSFFGCEVIYNYDLSVGGIDNLPATKSCIEKYLPHSVDAHKGSQYNVIKETANIFNDYELEIIDSLIADSVLLDTGYILNFKILALDPDNEITEVEIIKTYYIPQD